MEVLLSCSFHNNDAIVGFSGRNCPCNTGEVAESSIPLLSGSPLNAALSPLVETRQAVELLTSLPRVNPRSNFIDSQSY